MNNPIYEQAWWSMTFGYYYDVRKYFCFNKYVYKIKNKLLANNSFKPVGKVYTRELSSMINI